MANRCRGEMATVKAVLMIVIGSVVSGCNEEGASRVQANAGEVVCAMKENSVENIGLMIGLSTDIAVAANVISNQEVEEGKVAIGQVMETAKKPIEAAKEAGRNGCRTAVSNTVSMFRQAMGR